MKPPPTPLLMLTVAMMLMALLPMPYGYYQLLRLVTVVTAGWTSAYFWQNSRQFPALLTGCIALLFNPVIPVSFSRETWSVLNMAAAGSFALCLYLLRGESNASKL